MVLITLIDLRCNSLITKPDRKPKPSSAAKRSAELGLAQQKRRAIPQREITRAVALDPQAMRCREPADLGAIAVKIAAIGKVQDDQRAMAPKQASGIGDVPGRNRRTGGDEIRKAVDGEDQIVPTPGEIGE